MTTETFLPGFPGFYETSFEFNSEDMEIEHINDERTRIGLEPIDYEDVKWDFKPYRQAVCKRACAHIEEQLGEIGLECEITFKELHQPREYNFGNDLIIVDVDFDPEKLRKVLFECPLDAFLGFLTQFQHQPGFTPFTETLAKTEPEYWKTTDFSGFHDFGLACDLLLQSHPDTDFSLDDFAEYATHECEVGIENYQDLTRIGVDIAEDEEPLLPAPGKDESMDDTSDLIERHLFAPEQ